MMDYDTWLRWLSAVTHGDQWPGGYTPGTNPLDAMTGPPQ